MNKRGVCFWILLPALLMAAGPVLAAPGNGAPQDVTECGTVLTEPGSYRLANDLLDCPGHGVVIAGSDITLHLKGHEIACAEGTTLVYGVFVAGTEASMISNVTIKNGSVTNCVDGILLEYTEDSKVMHVNSTANRWIESRTGFGVGMEDSRNNMIMHNHVYANEGHGIASEGGDGNLFMHNTMTGNGNGWEGAGVGLGAEVNSRVMCNWVQGNTDGILLAPGSTGNLIRGNVVSGNFSGVMMMGYAWYGEPWFYIPAGNTVRTNVVEGNFVDFWEIYLDLATYNLLLDPGDACQNTWQNNQYVSGFGPEGCFGEPVVLDAEDVCALDD